MCDAYQVGHLMVDVMEALFYTMIDMAGGDVSSWDTDIILGKTRYHTVVSLPTVGSGPHNVP